MRTRIRRILAGLIACTLAAVASLFAGAQPAQAVTGHQGYAVYRDGVLNNVTWHAAILDDPTYNSSPYPVTMAPGPFSNVKYASWSDFLAGNKYKGLYRPKTAPTTAARDNFVYMERKLTGEAIPYSVVFQVDYNWATSGTWVDPSEIKAMRCDGVVEYVYEWYGYRIYGDNTYWDVTRSSFSGQAAHSGLNVTPSSQAGLMTRITTDLP